MVALFCGGRAHFLALVVLLTLLTGRSEAETLQTGTTTSTTSTTTTSVANSAAGVITYYAAFDQDIVNFAKRTDIKIYPVDASKKQQVMNKMKSFSKNFGIDVSGVQADSSGRIYKKVEATGTSGVIDRYFSYAPSADSGGIRSEVVAVRKTWGTSGGSKNILSDQSVQTIADKARGQYSLPLTGTGEVVKVAAVRQIRQVQGDEGATTVLRQIVGYYRMLGERQVANSNFLVYVDNSDSSVAGMVLKSWWPLSTGQTTSIKSASLLKQDVTQEVTDAVGTLNSQSSATVDSCQATYYQTKQNVVPAVTCAFRVLENGATVDAGAVTVSQGTQYSLKLSQ